MNFLTELFSTVFRMSLTAVPVIAVLFALRFLLRKAPKGYSYILWAAAAFRLLCPVSVPSSLSLFNLLSSVSWAEPVSTAGTGGVQPAAVPGRTAPQPVTAAPAVSILTLDTSSAAPAAASAIDWTSVAAIVWAAGILCLLLWTAWRLFRLRRMTCAAVQVEDNIWESDAIPGPFVLGLLRPKIFLPVWLEGESRTYVLCHERYHLRRGDVWAKALGQMILILHWFNPAVWLMLWAADRDMELSCDEGALRKLGGEHKKDYSRTLLSLGSSRREFGPALAFGTPAVKTRIKHALNFKRAGRITVALSLVVLLIAGLTCCTNASSGAAEQDWAQQLYEARVQYVGDASAVGALCNVALEHSQLTDFEMALYTEAEPYGPYGMELRYQIPAETEAGDPQVLEEMFRTGVLMLALTENLDYIQQGQEMDSGETLIWLGNLTAANTEEILEVEDLKACAESPEGIAELLERIDLVLDQDGIQRIQAYLGA